MVLRLSQVPAMDDNWVVTTFHLNINHLSHHTGDRVQVRAGAIRSPVVHMKLNYLMRSASLFWTQHTKLII